MLIKAYFGQRKFCMIAVTVLYLWAKFHSEWGGKHIPGFICEVLQLELIHKMCAFNDDISHTQKVSD